mmetsp:Transcript_15271/g.33366  ORF Transcript_15271/g.33366 Transcript_15271/m.33366 type:complete len:232 (+) Transcript_15271:962-1657(+)
MIDSNGVSQGGEALLTSALPVQRYGAAVHLHMHAVRRPDTASEAKLVVGSHNMAQMLALRGVDVRGVEGAGEGVNERCEGAVGRGHAHPRELGNVVKHAPSPEDTEDAEDLELNGDGHALGAVGIPYLEEVVTLGEHHQLIEDLYGDAEPLAKVGKGLRPRGANVHWETGTGNFCKKLLNKLPAGNCCEKSVLFLVASCFAKCCERVPCLLLREISENRHEGHCCQLLKFY